MCLNQGKVIFKDGLSHLPDELFNELYIARLASSEYILSGSRISTGLREGRR